MAFTQADLDAILTNREAEGLYLEFKRGQSLTPAAGDAARTELVKDCVGFANAAGGVILYGVAEEDVGGPRVALGLDPVTDPRGNQNWIAEVLRSNTSPPLTKFHVTDLPQEGGGRVVAVEIESGSTAHQSLRDHKYYQRTGPTTVPMVDFQIRDVMGRRTKPDAEVQIDVRVLERDPLLHRYQLTVRVENTGPLTMEKWWLDVDMPAAAVRDTRNPGADLTAMNRNYQKLIRKFRQGPWEVARCGFGDPFVTGDRFLLHPGQSLELNQSHTHFAHVFLEVDSRNLREFSGTPLTWTLYFRDHEPKRGQVPFAEWCVF